MTRILLRFKKKENERIKQPSKQLKKEKYSLSGQLGKPPSNSRGGHLGIARKGGWVSTLARMAWGTFLEKIKWAFAWFWGGLNPCQDDLGHFCSEN